MKNRYYIILLQLIILGVFFSSCRKPYPSPDEMKNYTMFIQNGDLDNVKKYYKKFGKGFLDTYGPGYYHFNPLEIAIFFHHYDIADFLISKGADVNGISPNSEKNIILTFVYGEDIEAVKYMIEKNAQIRNLNPSINTQIAFSDNLELIKLLGNEIKDVNESDEEGYTALHILCFTGNLKAVKYLIEQNAEINCKTEDCKTPLITAVSHNHPEVAEYLISQGADISIIDSEGHDALWFANELGLKIKGLNY